MRAYHVQVLRTDNKGKKLFTNGKLQGVFTHKGMNVVLLRVTKAMHNHRIGAFVFNRKQYRRPARLKKKR